ncbi:MAG: hypothetical protein J1E05_03165, partial [Eubacterium sp.]|nr:hypothetical protein [Eubacterium sp.]
DSKRRVSPSAPKKQIRILPYLLFSYNKRDSKTWLQISCAALRLAEASVFGSVLFTVEYGDFVGNY